MFTFVAPGNPLCLEFFSSVSTKMNSKQNMETSISDYIKGKLLLYIKELTLKKKNLSNTISHSRNLIMLKSNFIGQNGSV